jgi:hypothetical protein
MIASDRLEYINATLAAIDVCWSRIAPEIQVRLDAKTMQLIAAENEQARGAIRCLRDLLYLPETLQSERDQITAALSDPDAA